jgi:hypothetical protein
MAVSIGHRATTSSRAVKVRRSLDRSGFLVLVVALLLAVVALPFAVASMVGSIKHPIAADAFHLSVPAPGQSATTAVNVRLVAIDETAPDVTLSVTGDRRCVSACGKAEVLQFFSLRSDPRGSDGSPPAQDVDIPATGEFDDSVVLPVSGDLGTYPFDSYRLLLGLGLARQTAGGQTVPMSAHTVRRQLDVSLDEQLARIDLATPRDVTSNYRFVGAQVALAAQIDLTRPLYLQVLTILIVMFIALAGVYSVVTRAFKEVIGTVGVVVLGVWGVRTLLVGSYPPDSTAVDLVLSFLILMILIVVMVRGLLLMWGRISSAPDSIGAGEASRALAEETSRSEPEEPFENVSDIA